MENITYEEFINNILETRGRFACGEEYHERHHIIPKCMGGGNEEENLIDLFAKEHFIAHQLLVKENPDNNGLIYAWSLMAWAKRDYQDRYMITPEEYETAKIALSESRKGAKNPFYGKKHTEETRKRISELVGGENHPNYGKPMSDETKKKISKKNSGENAPNFGKHFTEEHKQKLAKSKIGNLNPNFGKPLTEATRRKISEANSNPSEELRKIRSINATGASNSRAKKVIRLSDLKVYGYMKEASKDNNICVDTIRKYCVEHNGFMFYDEWLTQQND